MCDEHNTNFFVDGNHLVANTSNRYFQFGPNGLALTGGKFYGYFTYQFSLENLTNLGEFTGLFDSYRISKVIVKIIPRATSISAVVDGTVGVGTNLPPVAPNIHYQIDHDDVSAYTPDEAGLRNLRERNNYKVHRMIRPLTIVIKPRYQLLVAGHNNITSGVEGPRKGWLDLAVTNMKHYGLKGIVEAINPLTPGVNLWFPFEIQTTYYMAFKGVR